MNLLNLFRHPKNLADLTPADLEARLADPDTIIIDVRTPHEFESGHIQGAIPIPLGRESIIATRWPQNTPLIFICKTGHRSQAAAATAFKLGYTNISHLQGGMDRWKREGKPMTH
ncbi:rhodanese-like domain-containing protein [Sulfobacillus thermosulfidooxidans]|uniref:rhodanese-like domain-containing protein n=1 Tax=Sulfobacillus thermosulfidooxidans TaxID=28034 RepID=UPI00096B850F|nr:rhodanese-like domain-containing protein [Sulfobacillus thermosulfidooxidans]OLZ11383.1 hypothetical protein BFX05_07840 [Sulfobacillus thermosulfidooxidans]OLZ14019.1 hypothetical protein BFX06_06840 [Sulfobacillus thermosulfidooxidans]OLZ19889.1 hypothetical protein BFX07_02020 [Sulfobacillus thermosulfidooxidans]